MNRKILILIIIILLVVAGFIFIKKDIPKDKVIETPVPQATSTDKVARIVDSPKVIATGLRIPWDIAFLSSGDLLVTERVGNLLWIGADGARKNISIPKAIHKGEGGLLGLKLHPDFENNNFIYLYLTTGQDSLGTRNAVIRYQFVNGELKDEKMIIDNIPGAVYHDGGRMEFGPDGLLYVTTGDATSEKIAQDLKSLGGKILRVKDDGSVPTDNPFGTRVYSLGHRNPQGLAWDNEGRLWETEHGRSGVTSGLDEINLILKGKNYGWPTIEGDETKEGLVNPASHSGAKKTWAPASALYWDGSLFFGGLKGEALYEAVLNGDKVTTVKEHLKGEYGRIRTVRLGLDGMFYLTTSNTDGRGRPVSLDDRIIKVDPKMFRN